MTEAATNERALSEAVDWLVRHEAAALSDEHRQAFERWLRTDALHQRAWTQVNAACAVPLNTVRKLQAQAKGVHVQAAMQALFRTRRRRVLRGALAVGGVTVAAALVAERLTPLGQLMADLRTGTGERRGFTLADGSTVLLDARSAADVHYVSGVPQLLHRAGALIAESAGPGAFRVRTKDGVVQLGAGRLMSRIHPDRTEVVAMEGVATVTPGEHSPAVLHAGGGVRFSAQALEPLRGSALDRTSWQQGMLAVDNWPLAEVIEALQAYFPGYLRVAPSVADLQVFGIFRLDVGEVLSTLAQTLPVQVRRLGPLISIDSRQVR